MSAVRVKWADKAKTIIHVMPPEMFSLLDIYQSVQMGFELLDSIDHVAHVVIIFAPEARFLPQDFLWYASQVYNHMPLNHLNHGIAVIVCNTLIKSLPEIFSLFYSRLYVADSVEEAHQLIATQAKGWSMTAQPDSPEL